MRKINQHIEIVASTVMGLSSMSQKSRLAALAVLSRHYTHVGITIVNNLSDLEALVANQPDLVFLGMKFIPSDAELGRQDPDRIWLSDYLDQRGIAYTGSGQAAHELELDKSLAKQRMVEAGLDTSPFIVARQHHPLSLNEVTLTFPVFIKPTDRGGGAGVDSASLATNFKELQAKVSWISSKLQADSLIEQYLPGREFSVAIIKDEFTDEYIAMPLELVAPADQNGARFLSAKIKSSDLETFKTITNGAIKTKVTELAMSAFHALGARDYGRIDVRLDESGTVHFLEANLIPSIIKDYGNFPKACMLNLQMNYETMLIRIVNLALARSSFIRVQRPSLGLDIVDSKIVSEPI